MKIGFVIPFFSPRGGGSAVVAYELARHLAARGHELSIFTTDLYRNQARFPCEESLSIFESRCLMNPSGFLYSPDIIHRLRASARGLDVFHLHNFYSYQNIKAKGIAVEYQRPYILQAHGSLPHIGKDFLKTIFDKTFGAGILLNAAMVVTASAKEAQYYLQEGLDQRTVGVIPVGIDTSAFSVLPSSGTFKKKFSVPMQHKIILYLGRIQKAKRIDFLIRSYAYAVHSLNVSDTVLVIAGPDDGYSTTAKSLAGSLGLSNQVLILGMVEGQDKLSAYVDSTICANLAPTESFGIVSLEAAMCHSPVVVSDGTPMSEYVKQGGFGFVVTFGDIEGLGRVLCSAVQNPEESRRMGENGQRYVSKNFSWEAIVPMYETIYAKSINPVHR
jgi:glycosyltransferase involved in cell wall biosynthesis